jgi:hypothetical protein
MFASAVGFRFPPPASRPHPRLALMGVSATSKVALTPEGALPKVALSCVFQARLSCVCACTPFHCTCVFPLAHTPGEHSPPSRHGWGARAGSLEILARTLAAGPRNRSLQCEIRRPCRHMERQDDRWRSLHVTAVNPFRNRRAGEDVADWWYVVGAPVPAPSKAEVAWTGKNEAASRFSMAGTEWSVRLYLKTWKNPHPAKEIKSLDMVTGDQMPGQGAAAPFLVALTGQERGG